MTTPHPGDFLLQQNKASRQLVRSPPYTGQKVYSFFSYFFRIILGCLPRASYVISEILSIPIWAQGRSGLWQGPLRGVGNIMGNIKGGFPGRRPEHYGEHYGDMLRILVSSIMFPIMFSHNVLGCPLRISPAVLPLRGGPGASHAAMLSLGALGTSRGLSSTYLVQPARKGKAKQKSKKKCP